MRRRTAPSRPIASNFEVVAALVPDLRGKTVVDVGCGTGGLVRDLAAAGAAAIGVDTSERLAGISEYSPGRTERYVEALGARLLFPDGAADVIVYFASFHHIPPPLMPEVLGEVRRVLKDGGLAVFVEPVYKKGAYAELTRLLEDERGIQKKARREIRKAAGAGFLDRGESFAYFSRSLEDFKKCMAVFAPDAARREACIRAAEERFRKRSRREKTAVEDIRYKSICRINVFQKPGI